MIFRLSIILWILSSCKISNSNEFSLDSNDSKQSTTYIKSIATGKVLEARNQGLNEGDLIQQGSYRETTGQEWRFIRHEDNIYSIISVENGRCFELFDDNQGENAPIGQKKCSGQRNQKWEIMKTSMGYTIKNTYNYKCLSLFEKGQTDGTQVVNAQCTNDAFQMWAVSRDFTFPTTPGNQAPQMMQVVQKPRKTFSPIIGIHAVDPAYHFTSENPVVETVKASFNMGFRMVKLDAKDRPALSVALSLPFSHVFLWFRTTKHWMYGMTPQFQKTEYDETYAFAKTLLDNETLAGRHIFIGHWEGDWLLLGEGNAGGDAPKQGVEGMIGWINLRQKAILDAKKASPNSKVNIYQYVEVNRVRDAMVGGKKRLVNEVLPHVKVDYVSYSGYDVQQDTKANIHATLDYIEKHLQPNPSIQGKRVFIGEFGMPLQGKSREEQNRLNQQFIRNFLSWGTPFLLYWSMYDTPANMVATRKMGLIDEKNTKIPFGLTMERFLKKQHEFVDKQSQQNDVGFSQMTPFVFQEFSE